MTEMNADLSKGIAESQTKIDFGITDAVKNRPKDKIVSMSGDVIFKDINLFIPELIINIALVVFGTLGVVLIRMISSGFLADYSKYVSPQALEIVTGHVGFLSTVLTVGIAIPILISFVLFAFKWWAFYPRGKKQFVIRAWKANIARIGVEEIKDNYAKFDAGKELADDIHINYSNAAIEYTTGRKIILLEEGQAENTSLHKNVQTNEKVKDRGNVNSSIASAMLKFSDYQHKKDSDFFNNPTNILLIIILLILVGFVLFMVFKNPESVATAVQSTLARGGA